MGTILPWLRTAPVADDLVTILGLGVYFLSTIYLVILVIAPRARPLSGGRVVIIPVLMVAAFQLFITAYLVKLLTTPI